MVRICQTYEQRIQQEAERREELARKQAQDTEERRREIQIEKGLLTTGYDKAEETLGEVLER